VPIPKRGKKEDKSKFLSRCMGDKVMVKEYPKVAQRYAICLGQWKKKLGEMFNNFKKEIKR